MSKLVAKVESIDNIDNLNIVSFKTKTASLKMMSLDINKDISIGKKVVISCKPSSIAIAKNFSGEISFSNQLECKVVGIKKGELLSIVTLLFEEFKLESLITTKTLERMDIKKEEIVKIFIKSSELSILESIDE